MTAKRVPLSCVGHTRPVLQLAYSGVTPDGIFLASASKGQLLTTRVRVCLCVCVCVCTCVRVCVRVWFFFFFFFFFSNCLFTF